MTVLTQGANTAVGGAVVKVAMTWPAGAGALDGSAYLLTASGKVRGDADMVFYNQPSGADGAVKVTARESGSIAFEIALSTLPAAIERIVFCLTVEDAGKTLAVFNGAALTAIGADGAAVASFTPAIGGASEAAMIIAELYRRNDQWKLRAVAQGFNGGLGPLARSFGIDVDEPAPAAAPAPPPPPAAPAAKPINLSKVTLDKARPTVSLEKRGSDFGEIAVNLNWSSGKGGGGFFGKSKTIDLDLGCLWEMSDGTKGIVQALGNAFGSLQSPPYIELSGDDRTGAVAAGETLRINGRRWSEIKRIALFAFIYQGAPNWGSTDGVITITMPDQPPIEIRLSDGPNDRAFCGLATIENSAGSMKFTRLIEYFSGHPDFDQRVGWGMRWKAGSK